MSDDAPKIPVARLDEPAPLFEARSTKGTVRLSDFAGRWVLLFAHPADFTPVCTSEFVALARASERFEALDCALIGLSADSVYSHIAWFDRIEADFGIRPQFPLLEDPSLAIATSYGMIHPGASSTATVRSVFVIDPQGILKAMVHYPMEVGRSVDELLRLVSALRDTAGNDGVAPADWREGEPLLASAPGTDEESVAAGPAWYAGGVR
ncbi:peroxiredoxin [Parvularcula lutaonensis]|uniref:Thioredoxin peroxidase n=1 Tax=Parvularcula lutaonensis TaxID=491923 RepID=A0ABV7MD25_9PROT|nr:peroxiredoxin [Parvularcula lutaonensis]GGY49371.1 peroxiredoxin [Parvularcula lutaonensis]